MRKGHGRSAHPASPFRSGSLHRRRAARAAHRLPRHSVCLSVTTCRPLRLPGSDFVIEHTGVERTRRLVLLDVLAIRLIALDEVPGRGTQPARPLQPDHHRFRHDRTPEVAPPSAQLFPPLRRLRRPPFFPGLRNGSPPYSSALRVCAQQRPRGRGPVVSCPPHGMGPARIRRAAIPDPGRPDVRPHRRSFSTSWRITRRSRTRRSQMSRVLGGH
jgi:hypothetical protein